MQKKLPSRPNLEHLRGQAKTLLTAFKAGDPQAVRDFADYHVDHHHPVDAVALADAQFVIARKNNFSSWPRLVHYVEQLRALEGTWLFTSLEVEGMQLPAPVFNSSKLLLNGDRLRMESQEANYEGIFDINVEVNPHTISIDFVEGPEAGNSSYGIYELISDDLKICLGLTGYARPSNFQTQPGSGHALETLRRGNLNNRLASSSGQAVTPRNLDSHEAFDSMTPELEMLQGEWIPISITRDGIPLPRQFYQSGRRVTEGNVTTVTFEDQLWMKALTRIGVYQEPHTIPHTIPYAIDYLYLDGPAAGQVQQGILSITGDKLQFCLAEPGSPRPSKFTSKPGSGFTLSTWQRKP